jgi:hypothetical protein
MLDAESFQKLLEAAWVLQRERDRRLSELPAGLKPSLDPPKEQAPVSVAPASLGDVLEAAAAVDEACAATISPLLARTEPTTPALPSARKKHTQGVVFPPMHPAVIAKSPNSAPPYQKIETAGTLSAAGHRRHEPQSDPVPQSAAETLPTPVRRDAAPRELIHWQKLSLVRLREKIQIRRQIRVTIPAHARRTAALYARIAVLLVVVALLVSQILSHRVGLPSVKAAFQSLKFAMDGSTPQVVEAQTRVDTGNELASTESSHLRVTDFDAQSAVEDLSRFEMQTLRRQAHYGDTAAALTLGMAYEVGSQVPQSCEQAAHWIAIAAADGNPAAEYNLALRFLNGDGVPISQDEARKWFREAANHGNSKAASALATLDRQSSPTPDMTSGHDDVARR